MYKSILQNQLGIDSIYYFDNKIKGYNNVNGPAYISYYENGNIQRKVFCKNNSRHNQNGPAKIIYFENGEFKNKQYWLNECHLHDINSNKELKQYIKLQNIL